MKKFFITITVSGLILLIIAGALTYILSRFALLGVFLSLTPTESLLGESNILVLGVDHAFGRRSDTTMVVHIDPLKKESSIISIPRDSLVVLPGRGLDKVNHAYAYGGIELSKKTVEDFLGVKIPYYIVVNMGGVENIIDQLGGVTLNIEKRMYYVDHAAGLYIDLRPGRQRLSGKEVMGYLRYRADSGDFARINRQQKFLQALAAEFSQYDNILKVPSLLASLLSYVETNLNLREIVGLSIGLRSAYELGQVYMTTLPGEDMMVDGIYYWRPDHLATQRIIEQFIRGKRMSSSG